MGNIPSLTYTIHHSTDRLRRQHDYYEEEILKTRKLVMGDSTADANLAEQYGIVSASDPSAHAVGSTDPLSVGVNAQNQLTVDVNPGTVVMKSGCWVELHTIIRQVAITETGLNIPNVVYCQYLLDLASDEPNRFDDPVTPYTVRVGDPLDSGGVANTQDALLGSMTVDTYNQLAESVKLDLVPLAVVTVQAVDIGAGVLENQLTVDQTTASYDFNRPWFSIVDHQHRSQVGTGLVTPTNPHGGSGNDMTIGALSMLQLDLDHGIVIAKDRSIAKVPGYRCTTAITSVSVDDAAGTLTGYANASYIDLPYFPVRVGRVWYESTSEVLAAVHVPQTHRVVFPYETPTVGETINVYYTRAEVAEPPLPGNTTFLTNGPATQELAIAGGLGLVSLSSPEETFADAYQIPMRYEMFMDGEGSLLKTPQVVYCWKKLSSIGTSDLAGDITPYGPGRLIMALSGADDVATLDIQIRVYGTNSAGTTVDELFSFNQTNWDPVPAIPAVMAQDANYLQFSTAEFATITNITIEAMTSPGPNAAIMIWMAQHSFSNYDKQADALHVATVDWDGYSFAHVYDKRIVTPTVRDEQTATADSSLQEMVYNLVAGGNATVYVDDFRSPQYHSLETPDELGENSAHFPTYNFSKQQVGLHGYYRSIAFPVHANSGSTWRVSLFGAKNLVDSWFPNRPSLQIFSGGAWSAISMSEVPGVLNTWEATLLSTPARVRVLLYPGQCTGMAIYG